MAQSIRSIMTSNPCTIDADKSVAYAAQMMREEDVGLAPIVEGDKLIGMLTDRDIATRVAAEGRDPEQVKVRDVASKQLVTIDPKQDLDEALRIMAKHQVRRLPVVAEDGRLVGVVAQADIARQSDDRTTGQLVEEISESGGQMSSFEEGRYQPEGVMGVQREVPEETLQETQPEEEGISRVRAASSRGRKRRTGTRKRSTKTRARSTTRRKSTGTRRKSTAGRKKTTARKSTSRKRSTGRKKTTGTRRKSTARKSTTRRKTTGRKKTTSRKRSTGRTTVRTAGRKGGRKAASRKRSSTARKSTTRKRSTASRKTTARRTTRRRTTRRKTSS